MLSTEQAKTMSDNPYVFVVGCPRSGTTLLQRMLNSHPQLAVANDSHFIPRALAGTGEPDPTLTPELIEKVWSYHRFYRLGVNRQALDQAAEGARFYSDLVSRLYDAFASNEQKPFAGEKTPDYARHIPLLHRLFPKARFIHIIRDGRDVALSTLDWATRDKGPGRWTWWDESPVATCALWWLWQIEGALAARSMLGPDVVCEIRYEELVAAPELELRRISSFLDFDYDASMERYSEGKAVARRSGISAKSAWLPPTSGLRDWRRQMSTDDAAIFEALAGNTLETLGYATRTRPLSRYAEHIVAESRAWWRSCNGKPATRRRPAQNHRTVETA